MSNSIDGKNAFREGLDRLLASSSPPPLRRRSPSPELLSLSDKTIAHLFLDGEITDSGLEGHHSLELLALLGQLAPYLEGHVSEEALAVITRMSQQACVPQDRAAKLRHYVDAIKNLPEGNSLLIPIGWTRKSSAHAMRLDIQRTSAGYDLTLINTGSGISRYHATKISPTKTYSSPFVHFKNVPIKLLLPSGGSAWIDSLLSLKDHPQPDDFQPSAIYEGPFYKFWKHYVPEDSPYFITPQRSGTCAWKSLLAYMRSKMPKADYKRLHFWIRHVALSEIVKAGHSNPMMIQAAARRFAQETRKKTEEGWITQEEATSAHALLVAINQQFVVLPPEVQKRHQLLTDLSVRCKQLENVQSAFFQFPVEIEGQAGPATSPSQTLYYDLPVAQRLLTQITELISLAEGYCEKTAGHNAYAVIVAQFVAQMPLDTTFWSQIRDKEKVVMQMRVLLESYYKHIVRYHSLASPGEMLTAHALYIHMFEIAKSHHPSLFAKFSPYNPWTRLTSDPLLQLTEPGQERQLNAIFTYFKNIGKKIELFAPDATLSIKPANEQCDNGEILFYRECFRVWPDWKMILLDRNLLQMRERKFHLDPNLDENVIATTLAAYAQRSVYINTNRWLYDLILGGFYMGAVFDLKCDPHVDKTNPIIRTHKIKGNGIDLTLTPSSKGAVYGYLTQLWPSPPVEKVSDPRLTKPSPFLPLSKDSTLNRAYIPEAVKEANCLVRHFPKGAVDQTKLLMRQCALSGVVREQQPLQLLSQLHANPSLFEDRFHQTIFWLEFFKTSNYPEETYARHDLEVIITKNPRLVGQMAEFVQNGLRHYIDLQPTGKPKVGAALFYIRLATEFACYCPNEIFAQEAFQTLHEEILSGFDYLHTYASKSDEFALIHLHRLHFELMRVGKIPEKGDKTELVVSWFGMQSFQIAATERLHFLEKSVHIRMHPLLKAWEKDETFDWSEIATTVCHRLGLSRRIQADARWTKQKAHLHLMYGVWTLNILTGQLLEDCRPLQRGVPNVNFETPPYSTLFGTERFSFFWAGEQTYLFDHPSYGQMRLINPENPSIQIYIGDIWYQYIPHKEVNQTCAKILPKTLIGGFFHWLSLDKSTFMITSQQAWDQPVVVVDQAKKQLVAGSQQVTKLPSTVSEFKKLEDRNHIEVYSNSETGKLEKIALPKCHSLTGQPLTFYNRPEGICWGGDTRFVLEKVGTANLLPVDEYLTLTNQQNQKRMLIVTAAKLYSTRSKAFAVKTALDLTREESKVASEAPPVRHYLEFELQEDRIIAQNSEGLLYLAYMRLQERKFDAVLALLDQVSRIDPLSEVSAEIMSHLLTYPSTSKHDAPTPTALILKALVIYFADQKQRELDFLHSTSELLPDILGLYNKYVDQLRQIPETFRLTHEEEGLLLNLFLKLSPDAPRYLARAKHLGLSDQETSVTAAKITLPSIPKRNNLKGCIYFHIQSTKEHLELAKAIASIEELAALDDPNFWDYWRFASRGTDEEKAWVVARMYMRLGYLEESTSDPVFSKAQAHLLLYAANSPNLQAGDPFPTIRNPELHIADIKDWYSQHLYFYQMHATALPHMPLSYDRPIELATPPEAELKAPLSADLTMSAIDSDPFFSNLVSDYFVQASPERPTSAPFPEAIPSSSYPDEYAPSVARELRAVVADYGKGAELIGKTTYFTATQIDEVIQHLKGKKRVLEFNSGERAQEILNDANRLPTDPERRLHRELDLQEKRVQSLTLSDLEALFLKRSRQAFLDANPAMDVDDIFARMGQWEIDQIDLLRAQQALEWAEKVKACQDPTLIKLYCNKLVAILKVDLSTFSDDERTNYLVFSRASGKHPRVDQRENVAKLTPIASQACILTMIMGAGKTAVVAPLWAKRAADAGKLPVFFVDSSQYGTVAHALQHSQQTCFGQKAFTIQYTRQELSAERLAYILDELKEAITQKKLLIMSPEMLQLFDLERFMTFTNPSDENAEKRLKLLTAILKIFKTDAVGLGDEIDILLRSDKEVTLPVGQIQRIDPAQATLAKFLFEALCSSDLQVKGMSMREFVRLEQKEQTYLSEEDWKAIRPIIAQHLAKTTPLLKLMQEHALHEAFARFVSGEDIEPENQFWRYVKQLHQAEDLAEKMAAELICLTKHLLQDVLPGAFRQMGGRNFGRWRAQAGQANTPGMVIPYLAADTPGKTQFAYHYEALVKHMMMAAQVGLEESQVLFVAERFEEMAHTQMQITNEKFNETDEAKTFEDLTGVSLVYIRDPRKLKQATAHVNKDLVKRFMFEAETANIYATFYAARLTSTAQSFAELIGSFSGMTGTPWNASGYAPDLADNVFPDDGTQGRILHRILERKTQTTVTTLDPTKIDTELEQFYHDKRFADGIFDAGALFSKSGMTNREIATHIVNFLKQKQGQQRAVLFFDKPDGGAQANQFTALILNEGNLEYKPLESTTTDELRKIGLNGPDDYVVFLPERQTTGTDIPFSLCARAYMTFDETMTLRTLLQTVMRLRDFVNRQQIHFILSEALRSKIPEGTDPVDFILQVALVNEARSKADSQLRAYKQMIDEVFKKHCRKLMESSDARDLVVNGFGSLVFPSNETHLYGENFGNEIKVDTVKSLRTYAQVMQKRLTRSLESHGLSYSSLDPLQDELAAICERAEQHQEGFVQRVRQIQDGHAGLEAEMLIERQGEMHQEQEQQQEQQVELEQKTAVADSNLRRAFIAEVPWYNDPRYFEPVIEGIRTKDIQRLQTTIRAVKEDNYPEFAEIFSRNLNATNNFIRVVAADLQIFSPLYRAPTQIMAVQRKEEFAFYLLSLQESDAIAEKLRQAYADNKFTNVWLITPRAQLIAPNPHDLPLDNPSLRKGLVELNILAGWISPLQDLGLMAETEMWLQDANRPLKEAFIKRRFTLPHERNRLEKSGILSGTSAQSVSMTSVARTEAMLAQRIVPDEIQSLTGRAQIFRLTARQVVHVLPTQVAHINTRFIRYLRGADQIRAVAPENVNDLADNQFEFITAQQAFHLTKVTAIRKLPQTTLQAIESKPSFIKSLTDEQVGWIQSGDWVADVNPEQHKLLSDEMKEHLPVDVLQNFPIDKLPDGAVAKVPDRLRDFTPARYQAVRDPRLIVHVQEVNLLSTQCMPHLIEAQVQRLQKPELISALTDPQLLHLSSSDLIPAGRLQRVSNDATLVALFNKQTAIVKRLLPAQLYTLYKKGCNVAENIRQSPDTAWITIIDQNEYEALLSPELIPHLGVDQLVHLRDKFRHITCNQLKACLQRSLSFDGKPVDRVTITEKDLEGWTLVECQKLFAIRPDAVAYLRNPDFIPDLSPAQKQLLHADCVKKATTREQFQALLPIHIPHVSGNVAHFLTEDLRKTLTPAQIGSATEAAPIRSFSNDQLEHINPEMAVHLTAEQWQHLPPSVINKMRTPPPLAHLSDQQLEHVHVDAFEQLSTPQLNKLKPEALKQITAKAVIQRLSSANVAHINPEMAIHLTDSQLPAVPMEAIQYLSETQFDKLDLAIIQRITDPTQIQRIKPNKIPQIDDQHLLQLLHNDQLRHINVNQAHKLTKEQRLSLSTDQVVKIDEPAALQSLEAPLIRHVNVNQVAKLKAAQRAQLTPDQISEIREQATLQLLEPVQVQHVHPNFVNRLTQSQRDHLVETQIRAIENRDALVVLSPAQVRHVHPNLSPALRRNQAQHLTAAQIGDMDDQDALRQLGADQIRHVAVNQLDKLADPQLQHLVQNQVAQIQDQALLRRLPNGLIQHVAVDQLHKLTDPQLQHLVQNQVAQIQDQALLQRLPDGLIQHVNVNQVHKLTVPQLQHLVQNQVAQIQDQALLQRLPDGLIQHVNVNQVHKLTVPQLQHLVQNQVAQIQDQALLQRLSDGLIQHVNVNQVHKLTVPQLQHLVQNQVAQIQDQALLQRLSDGLIQHVNVNQVHKLTDPQLQHLVQNQVVQIQGQALLQRLPDARVIDVHLSQIGKLTVAQQQLLPENVVAQIDDGATVHALPDRLLTKTTPDQLKLMTPGQQQKIKFLGAHLQSKALKVTFIAVGSLGSVALIFGLISLLVPTPITHIITLQVGQTALIAITASGGGLIIICSGLALERLRRRKALES